MPSSTSPSKGSRKILSKKEKLEKLQERLENYHARLSDEFPDLELWTTGSVAENSFEIGSSLID